jgi:hypothetical protein
MDHAARGLQHKLLTFHVVFRAMLWVLRHLQYTQSPGQVSLDIILSLPLLGYTGVIHCQHTVRKPATQHEYDLELPLGWRSNTRELLAATIGKLVYPHVSWRSSEIDAKEAT